MTNSQIELVADEVLKAHNCNGPPVDVFGIATAEGIELASGDYGDDFHGRIEYHEEIGKFFLFHPSLEQARNIARIRFSVGHELGHYFLDHHRELLIRGAAHNSASDFICEDHLEREADKFAAALLLPGFAMKQKVAKRSFMTLAEVLILASDWQSSATSAVIRYAKFTTEACVVVLSEAGKIVFWVPSDEAVAIGFRHFSKGSPVPRGSVTALVTSEQSEVRGSKVKADEWFPQRMHEGDLWEEAFPLGNSGRVLTLLASND